MGSAALRRCPFSQGLHLEETCRTVSLRCRSKFRFLSRGRGTTLCSIDNAHIWALSGLQVACNNKIEGLPFEALVRFQSDQARRERPVFYSCFAQVFYSFAYIFLLALTGVRVTLYWALAIIKAHLVLSLAVLSVSQPGSPLVNGVLLALHARALTAWRSCSGHFMLSGKRKRKFLPMRNGSLVLLEGSVMIFFTIADFVKKCHMDAARWGSMGHWRCKPTKHPK